MTEQTPSPNQGQIDYWNTSAGQTWSRFQAHLDAQLAPLGGEAMRALGPKSGETLLDIGCGCGDTTIALAQQVGAAGAVVGVDISALMLDVARTRPIPVDSAVVTFEEADAQTDDLGTARFDAAFSRFGVMFFEDPTAAFANIAKALKSGGRLGFVCWRPYDENVWMKAPMDAALDLLPPRPPIDPLAPGPFAFADPERVTTILVGAGYTNISIRPYDAEIGQSDLETSLQLALNIGPLGRALKESPDQAGAVVDAVKAALAAYSGADGRIALPAAVWIVTARVE